MIRSQRAHLHLAVKSHAGISGKNNEDRYAVTSYILDKQSAVHSLLAVVADGIGGHRGGEVAAELAVNYITQTVAQGDPQQPQSTLERAIHTASDAINTQAAGHEYLHGMGATCACVWVIADRLFTASVGDSRIYLLRGGEIHQVTVDHTWVQEATDRGLLTPEQAREHPNVHVIRRYLGSPDPPEVDFRLRLGTDESDAQACANQGLVLRPGDTLLLCSDGLTDLVWDDEIQKVILTAPDLTTAAQSLVDMANQRGGHDNITIVLLRVPQVEPKPAKRRRLFPWLAGGMLAVLLMISGLVVAGWYLLQPVGRVTPGPEPAGLPKVTLVSPETFHVTPSLPPSPPATATVPGPTYTPWPTNTP